MNHRHHITYATFYLLKTPWSVSQSASSHTTALATCPKLKHQAMLAFLSWNLGLTLVDLPLSCKTCQETTLKCEFQPVQVGRGLALTYVILEV